MSQNPILVNSRISLHLDYSEVRCQCRLDGSPECTGGILRAETAMIFEKLRVAVSSNIGRETPLHVASGLRCRPYNARILGASTESKHIHGMALDILKPAGIDLQEFWELAHLTAHVYCRGGAGFYWSWEWQGKIVGGVHLDIFSDVPNRRWRESEEPGKIVWGTPLKIIENYGILG